MVGRNMLSMSGLSLYRNAVQFGLNMVIAAHVAPSDYGLVVFTTPFLVLSALLTDLGLASALVRAPRLTRDGADAAFGVMLAGGSAAAALLIALAWPLEHWLAMPRLAPVMAAMALATLGGIAATTPRALLERDLRYGRIATVEAVAIGGGAIAALVAVRLGAGIWALVGYNLLVQLARALAFVWLVRGRVRPRLAVAPIRPLISFGGWVLVTNLLNFLARNLDNLLIGAWLGAAAVGVYGLAYQFMLAPLMAITWPTSGILLATLRGRDLTDAPAQDTLQAVLSATSLIVTPAMGFLMIGLHWPAAALLSPRWEALPAIVAWLAPAGALQAIASYNGALLLTAGRARAQFVLTVLNTLVLAVTFLVALPFGLMTLVRAYAVVTSLLSVGFLAMMVVLSALTWRQLARALGPALAATAAGLAAASTLVPAPGGWGSWLGMTCLYGASVLAVYAIAGAHVRGTVRALTVPADATGK